MMVLFYFVQRPPENIRPFVYNTEHQPHKTAFLICDNQKNIVKNRQSFVWVKYLKMQAYVLFIVFLIYILLICMWYLRKFEAPPTKMDILNMFEENMEKKNIKKVECMEIFVPCFNDFDCIKPCLNGENTRCLFDQKGEGVSGSCVHKSNESIKPPQKECIKENGLAKVVENVDGILQYTCVSLYPELIDDTGNPRHWVCNNGTLNLHFDDQNSYVSCICSLPFITVWFLNSPNVPRCVHKESIKFIKDYLKPEKNEQEI